ncbi:MAG: CRTAC1 family protein, partial [Gammaproteobacteria bacterium]|nr:CRTAC1 family protein [Gammaproteobacteria bacterium]
IYVANDGMPNLLWRNSGNGAFRNIADIAGVAVNMDGRPEASMGVDSGDFDGDGDEDLFMTHLNRESNTLYVNEGSGYFDDRSVSLGLAGASLNYTGFGTAWFDYDNDGDLDLFSANGAVTKIQALIDAGDPFPLHQRNQLFANDGTGNYLEVSAESGLQLSEVSRGAAFGDLDNDGDPDIVVANNNGPVRLLRNNTGHRSDWIGFRVLTADGLRDALGARVRLLRDNKPLVARIGTDGSYASCNDARVVFGLGDETEDSFSVEVAWPGGVAHRFDNLAPNRYHELVPP